MNKIKRWAKPILRVDLFYSALLGSALLLGMSAADRMWNSELGFRLFDAWNGLMDAPEAAREHGGILPYVPMSSCSLEPGSYGQTTEGSTFTMDASQVVIANEVLVGLAVEQASYEEAKATIMAVLQESTMGNPNQAESDRDSQGILQQRESQDWQGDLSDPKVQVTNFLNGSGTNHGYREALGSNLGDRIQDTQASAYPDEYDKWEPVAEKILSYCQPSEQPPTILASHTSSYYQEISSGSEFGGGSEQRWWFEPMRIEIHGEPNTQDLQELDRVVEELRSLTGHDIAFVKSDGNVEFHFAPESDFQSIEPNYIPVNMGFAWVGYSGSSEINQARILISTEGIRQAERNHLIREELTQSMGLMQDSDRHQDSIFFQGWTETTEYSELDKQLIRMHYSQQQA
ncbi:MAG: DUF2927 domain-containing protein [Elainellaceae cyanobacterium]